MKRLPLVIAILAGAVVVAITMIGPWLDHPTKELDTLRTNDESEAAPPQPSPHLIELDLGGDRKKSDPPYRTPQAESLFVEVSGPTSLASNTPVAILPWTADTARLANTIAGLSKQTVDRLARRSHTDSDGRIAIPLIELPCFVAAASSELAPNGILVEQAPDDRSSITLKCDSACSVSGSVTVRGVGPEAGILVVANAGASADVHWGRSNASDRTAAMLFRQEAVTAADGSFTLYGLPTGNSYLHVEDQRYSADGHYLVCDRNSDTIDWTVQPAATVVGVVLDRNGAPVEGAWVNSTETLGVFDEEQMDLSITDDTGAFELRTRSKRKTFVRVLHMTESAYHHPIPALSPGETRHVIVRLPATGPITGRVTNDIGEPVHAMIVAYRSDTTQWVDASSTDEDGHFTLPRLEEGGTFRIDAMPYSGACIARVGPIHAGTEGLEVECLRPAVISGTVTLTEASAARRSMQDVRVRALTLGPDGRRTEEQSATPNLDGLFAINVFPGRYRVDAICDGFAIATKSGLVAHAGARTDVELRLEPGTSIQGRVVDSESHRPVTSAQIELLDMDIGGYISGTLDASTASDIQGAFILNCITADGEVGIRVSSDGYAIRNAVIDRNVTNVIKLKREATLIVTAEREPGTLAHGIRATVVAGSERVVEDPTSGRITVDGLAPGPASVSATLLDDTGTSITRKLTLEPGQTHELRLQFGGPCDLDVNVDPELGTQRFTGWWISAWEQGAPDTVRKTFFQGDHGRLLGLPEGPTRVRLYAASNTDPLQLTREVQLVLGARNELTFKNRGLTFTGMIEDGKHNPIPGAIVYVWGPRQGDEWGPARSARTANNGTFTMLDLLPGEYEALAEAPGFADAFVEMDLARRVVGDTERHDFTLVPEVIIDATCRRDGSPLPGVTVYAAVRKDNQWEWLTNMETDETGKARLRNIVPGDLRLLARGPGHFTEIADIEAKAGEHKAVTLNLRPGRDLTVRVMDRRGFPVSGAEVMVTAEGFSGDSSIWLEERRLKTSTESLRTDHRGEIELRGVPADALELHVGDQTLAVPPGTLKVTITTA